jgi:hypothetical protein
MTLQLIYDLNARLLGCESLFRVDRIFFQEFINIILKSFYFVGFMIFRILGSHGKKTKLPGLINFLKPFHVHSTWTLRIIETYTRGTRFRKQKPQSLKEFQGKNIKRQTSLSSGRTRIPSGLP